MGIGDDEVVISVATCPDQQVPGPLRVLVEDRKTVTFAACGDEHTLLLTAVSLRWKGCGFVSGGGGMI